jgi:hypothetical protein
MPEPLPEPEIITWQLSSDMTPNELIKVLEYLPRRDEFFIIRMDRDVRDYLLRILKQR